ncbi:MAG: hypothetical protein MJ130_05745, partial [Lachnospiraceae bacterium]|nr:hypothetical protein [Lachnospiraceae bacterium]
MSNVKIDNDIKRSNKEKLNSDNNTKTKYETIIKIVFWVVVAIYGALCLYLYYNQSIQPAVKDNSVEKIFESDLPFHISMVVDDGWYYSVTAFIYLALYNLAGKTTVLIAIFLALVSVGTLLITEKILSVMGIRKKAVTCGGALILNLVMPFYVRWAGMYRYVSYQSGNVWHNSTYQCMKLAALICMLLFIEISSKIKEDGITAKELILFALALAICTGIKPSFLTVFAPAMAIKLLIIWLKDKVPFKRILLWGLTVIPSCGVVLWQNAVLFGEDTENGFKISFMETFSLHANHPKITVLLSLAFPIVVFVCYVIDLVRHKEIKKFLSERMYLFSILMASVGFGEAILLIETGSRSRDGNFLWGYAIALFWLYLVSFLKWNELLEKKRWILLTSSTLVLIYQLYCG